MLESSYIFKKIFVIAMQNCNFLERERVRKRESFRYICDGDLLEFIHLIGSEFFTFM